MPRTLKQLLKSLIPERQEKIAARAEELRREETLRQALMEVAPEVATTLVENDRSITEAASHSLSRVHAHIEGREVGMISAHRATNTTEENNRRHAALKDDIRKSGFGHIPIRGSYTENKGTPQEKHVREKSFMVIGHKKNSGLKKFLLKHGEKYEQESVIHKPHDSKSATLHNTTGDDKGKSMDIGHFHANKTGEYHSALKGGKKNFQFEDYFYISEKSFSQRRETLFHD